MRRQNEFNNFQHQYFNTRENAFDNIYTIENDDANENELNNDLNIVKKRWWQKKSSKFFYHEFKREKFENDEKKNENESNVRDFDFSIQQ